MLAVDQLAFADLGTYWPPVLSPNSRNWVVENVTGGIARNGRIAIGLEATADLSRFTVARLSGTLEGDDLTVSWLRPVPPIEQGKAQLRFVDPDTIDIILQAGRQRLSPALGAAAGRPGGPVLRSGRMRITGLTVPTRWR